MEMSAFDARLVRIMTVVIPYLTEDPLMVFTPQQVQEVLSKRRGSQWVTLADIAHSFSTLETKGYIEPVAQRRISLVRYRFTLGGTLEYFESLTAEAQWPSKIAVGLLELAKKAGCRSVSDLKQAKRRILAMPELGPLPRAFLVCLCAHYKW